MENKNVAWSRGSVFPLEYNYNHPFVKWFQGISIRFLAEISRNPPISPFIKGGKGNSLAILKFVVAQFPPEADLPQA